MRRKLVGGGLAVALAVSGCATPGGPGGESKSNCAMAGAAAALVCGALASGNKRVGSALACATGAILICEIANSYKAEQVRTAAAVQEDLRKANRPIPATATVLTNVAEITPGTAISRGQRMNVVSQIVVAPGRDNAPVKVEEEVAIFDSAGERWGDPLRKVANPGGQAGEFKTTFSMEIPKNMSQDRYQIRRAVFLNGVRASEDGTKRFQVVESGFAPVQLALAR
jgi:hypothetical protein